MARRVGAATSTTRDGLLDALLRLIVAEGYAGVTYRKLAAEAGVTASLVQYYFPHIDDAFVAAIRREGSRNVRRLTAALDRRPGDALRVVWEFCREEAATTAMLEFMAAATHRPAIGAEIEATTRAVHDLQRTAIEAHLGHGTFVGLPPAVVHFLLAGIPKMLQLEEGIGESTAHPEVVALVEQLLGGGAAGAPSSRPSRARRR